MPWYDLPAEQLKDYRTGTAEPAGLDRWWRLRWYLRPEGVSSVT